MAYIHHIKEPILELTETVTVPASVVLGLKVCTNMPAKRKHTANCTATVAAGRAFGVSISLTVRSWH